jgi:hypothetical protein
LVKQIIQKETQAILFLFNAIAFNHQFPDQIAEVIQLFDRHRIVCSKALLTRGRRLFNPTPVD